MFVVVCHDSVVSFVSMPSSCSNVERRKEKKCEERKEFFSPLNFKFDYRLLYIHLCTHHCIHDSAQFGWGGEVQEDGWIYR